MSIDILRRVEKATVPTDLFTTGKNPVSIYSELAKACHPDRYATADAETQKLAGEAFRNLGKLYKQLTDTSKVKGVVIGKWEIGDLLATGDICDLYMAKSTASAEMALKIARNPKDNDLMRNERHALKTLQDCTLPSAGKFKGYFPSILEFFNASGRGANVISRSPGLTLADILKFYPAGLDFRHIVWMMNRLLSALGFSHSNGIIHGAIFPEHLVYDAESHNLSLVDWCYSVTNTPITAIVGRYRAEYPREVTAKKVPSAGTDLYMAAKTLRKAADRVPKRFNPLFDWCLAESQASRPKECFDFQTKWLSTAKDEYGEPRFVRLNIPVH